MRTSVFTRFAVPIGLISVCVVVGWAATVPLAVPNLAIAAALAFLFAALVSVHLVVFSRSGDALNLLSLTGAFYLLSFCLGGIYVWLSLPGGSRSPIIVTISHGGLATAIMLAAVAWLCLAAGYLMDPLRIVRSVWRPPSHLNAVARTGPLIALLLGIGWAGRMVLLEEGNYYHIHAAAVSPSATSWFVHTVSLLPLVALALASSDAFKPSSVTRSHGARRLFAILVFTELAWAVPTGSRESIVTILLVVIVVRYYTKRRLPSLKVAVPAILLLVFVVFPVINTYRSTDFRASPYRALSSAIEGELHRTNGQAAVAGEQTLARFADVTALARIAELGRNRMSFTTTDTIRYSLEGLVPRALFPQKLDATAFDNEFGRAYGFLSPGNFSTAIAATQPGELYLGGGWLALVPGMALLGGLLRMLDEYLGARRTDTGVLALYAVTVPIVLVGLETSIAIGFVGAIKAVALLGLVVAATGWLLSQRRTNSPVVQPRLRGV